MSARKKNRTTTRSATGASGNPVDEAAVVPVWGTDAEKTLWAVLGQYPGSTATELADAAGIANSTARRILSRWAGTGAARRDRDPNNTRTADRWSANTSDEAAGSCNGRDAAPESGSGTGGSDLPTPTGTDGAPSSESGTASAETGCAARDVGAAGFDAAAAPPEASARLAPGALRGQVEDFLRDHPEGEFSPHEIGKLLGRSSGAVHNALAKLATLGTARRTSDRPRKFALATA
ncbi:MULTISPECIES: hypothetical protein [Nocardia]|uniref:hypothetical protein n=1 Tax=Nocardia TaxID=1817 RepID=UPI0007EB380D|nr:MULTISPECIES: hypothetical protein [Nocardia]MBF6277309.1 hypothetical protein [Nocardia nova]OBA51116.1 hypothetical protein A5789_27990 [Nocardia sp. 852002-51101_SCH5132738]OBB52142.1 hypothetical protein A5748_15800 [Nocardia sp. 852002-51244_SCH5132740]OBF72663.1 hypothetical protein A9X06_28100 [Mycobacterium sp. 852002-51759_SCH5129042]